MSSERLYKLAGPALFVGGIVSVVTLLYGDTVFGAASGRARIYPAWTGWALVVSGVLAIVTTVIRLVQPTFTPVLADAPFLLFFVAVGGMGYWLGMRDAAAAAAPASATT